MKPAFYSYRPTSGFLSIFLLGLFLTISACDTLEQSTQPSLDESAISAGQTERLHDLNLTASQTGQLAELKTRYEDVPGGLWHVAAGMQATLTDSQKERLIASMENWRNEPPFKGLEARRGPRSGRGVAANLDLTESQKEQLQTVRQNMRDQMKALQAERRAGNLTDEEFRKQAQTYRESMHSALSDVLTADQLEKLEQERQQLQSRRGDRGQRRLERGEARSEMRQEQESAMIDALGLSEAQLEQIKALREERRAAVKSSRETLRERLQAGEIDRETVREMMKEEREAARKELSEILTEEQLEIMDLHRALASRKMGSRGRK